jgi:type IV pilus assembly protein PilA
MKSTKCVACGFVGWSDVENCKACGAPLNQQPAHVPSTAPVYTTHYEHWDQPQEGQEKGLAILALVLGIIGFFTFGIVYVGAIIGIVVAAKALGKVKREPWRYGGRGIAIAGLVLNIVALSSLPIAMMAAIAIPNLLASRRAANEGSAIHSLREISGAQATYHSNFDKYATLEELSSQDLINPRLGSGTRNGYNFTVELTTDEMDVAGFAAVAVPETYRSSGMRSFYVDETSVIRAGDNHGGPSTKMDDPLDYGPDYSRRSRSLNDRPQAVY